jgi:hypothetical protein
MFYNPVFNSSHPSLHRLLRCDRHNAIDQAYTLLTMGFMQSNQISNPQSRTFDGRGYTGVLPHYPLAILLFQPASNGRQSTFTQLER